MAKHCKFQGMRVFILLWWGQMVSQLGSALSAFALGIWVYQRTGSITQFALTSLATVLPPIVIAPVAGILIDRWNRRWVMILSDCGAGLTMGALAILLAIGHLQIWHVYLVTTINSAFNAIQLPAYNAAASLLVPKQQLGHANGMLQLAEALIRLIAPVLAGGLLAMVQLKGIIAIDFVTFFFSLVILFLVRFPNVKTIATKKVKKSSLLDEIFYGWNYIKNRKGLLGLLFFSTINNFLAGVVQVLFTPLVLSFASPTSLGMILSIGGIGMLVGSLVMSTFGGSPRRINSVFSFMLFGGLCILSTGLRTSITLLSVTAFLFFFGLPIINGSSQIIFQKKVAHDVQGRVFSLKGALGGAAFSLAYVVAGPLADRVFEPLMTAEGLLAGSIGQIIGVGYGRGIALMFIVIGTLTILVTITAYQYTPLRLVENQLPDVIADEAVTNPCRNLIGMLLTYPHKTEEILQANQGLIDADLLQMMEQIATQMSDNGSQEAAALLRDRSQQLKREVVIVPQTVPAADDGFNLKDIIEPDRERPKSKPRFRWAMVLAVPLLLAGLVVIKLPIYNSLNSETRDRNAPVTPKPSVPVNKTVAALGRIQPKDKVISVSGSSSLQHARVAQILVNEGDKVKRGQLIAVLDNLNQLQANLEQAKLDVRVAQAELAKIKAGESKKGEIAAQEAVIANLNTQLRGQVATQKAKIASLKAELANAQTDLSRFEMLYAKGAISASDFDGKRLKVTTLQEQLNEAQANLNQTTSSFREQIARAKAELEALKEVRPVDVQVAQTQLEKVIAAIPKAEADLDLAYVHAPVDGQILTIHTFAGENISNEGIIDLAQTHQMYVVAEVYETDIGKIHQGQKATISSPTLPRNFKGTVEQIGLVVGKKDVINSNPTLDIDARVVKVRIRLDSADTQSSARLINLQVDVKISTN